MNPRADNVTLFVAGDIMTGRGIDQILPHPSRAHLFEPFIRSALTYVELAEKLGGPIPRHVGFDYVWGEALDELKRAHPDVRLVNLETAVTTREEAWPHKDIHYRMHPANVPCLTTAGLDCCVLANNHVLDWGYAGLSETLSVLHAAGVHSAGAGHNATEAEAPAVLELWEGVRVLVFAFGVASSGVPPEWAATEERAGVNWFADLSDRTVERIARQVSRYRRSGDLCIASIHWGKNWGYRISGSEREFAHRLIDTLGMHLVHGHSSHHVKGIEVYQNKTILYGCGDLLNDYEGIGGYESFRGDLALMFFPTLDASGNLMRLEMTPTQTRRFQIHRAPPDAAAWLAQTLNRECASLGTSVTQEADGRLQLRWSA
jgi:poly-gamma-glutamate capsule biosynthesis protein CapA/YwtB (metallophosphatase superfamily)